MSNHTPKFISADLTVLGHFNPAILTHRFLTEICHFELAGPQTRSPEDLGVVSEIVYEKMRWFMDLNRMMVENSALESLSDFTSPRMGLQYLDVLPYTPVVAAGINLHLEFHIQSPPVFWKKLATQEEVRSLLDQFQVRHAQMKSQFFVAEATLALVEWQLAFRKIQTEQTTFKIARHPTDEYSVKVDFNHEWRGLDTDRARLDLIASTYQDVAEHPFSLMKAISQQEVRP